MSKDKFNFTKVILALTRLHTTKEASYITEEYVDSWDIDYPESDDPTVEIYIANTTNNMSEAYIYDIGNEEDLKNLTELIEQEARDVADTIKNGAFHQNGVILQYGLRIVPYED